MREVKEKSPLKARAAETLKSTPQAAFRRGADAAFQQLRQELCEAAQDGQPEDRYESGKITDTADHAVRQVSRLAEKAVHKLPKTKSEQQREARTEFVSQSERPQQPSAAPMEYTPQSHAQAKPTVRKSASPIREKPVPPTSGKQSKPREYTSEAKTPVSPSQHPASRIHENARAVATETTPPATECSAREMASPIKEKPVPPANAPQSKMRKHTPTADAPVQQLQHPASQIQEKAVSVKEKSPPASAFTQTPAVRESTRPYVENAALQRPVRQRSTPLRQETH